MRLSLSLEDGQIYDELRNRSVPEMEASIYCILSGYADTTTAKESRQLVSFAQLPGGYAYHTAFNRRAIQPIEGYSIQFLRHCKSAELLGATRLEYGNCSVKIDALPLVSVHVVLWSARSEFPTSANILFDSSVGNYLTTEQIVMLGELTFARLKHSKETINY